MKIGLFIFLGFIGLEIVGSLLPKPAGQTSTSQATASDSQTIESSAEKPIAVSAIQLFGAYQANEASAQGYFGDRNLLVTGTVDKVALDIFDNPEILLRTPNQFMSAHAALADDAKASAGKFGPGERVRLLCNGVSEVASIPMLKDCREAPADLKGEPVQWRK